MLAFALFGSLRYTRERLSWLVRALLVAGLAAVCLIGLVSRVLPHTWPTASSFYDSRLDYPLTYWNAEGMIAAIVLILGFHLTADRAEHWSVRVLAAAVLPGVAATLLLTFSRGAMGVAIDRAARLLPADAPEHASHRAARGVPTVAIALRSAWDATLLATAQPTSAAAVVQGHHVAIVVGACMLGAGLLRAVLLLADRRDRAAGARAHPASPRAARRRGRGVGSGCSCVALALALGAGASPIASTTNSSTAPTKQHVAQTRERLTDPANDGRLPLWRAAVRDLRNAQAARHRRRHLPAVLPPLPHRSALRRRRPLAVPAEPGRARHRRLRADPGRRARHPRRAWPRGSVAPTARCTRRCSPLTLAWAVHQAFDWDWQMPAVTLGVFMLAGLALARPARRQGRASRPAGRPHARRARLAACSPSRPLLVGTSYARLQQSAAGAASAANAPAPSSEALSSLSLSAKRPQAYVIIGVCDLRAGLCPGRRARDGAGGEHSNRRAGKSGTGSPSPAPPRAIDPHAAIARAIALNPLEHGLRSAARSCAPTTRVRGNAPLRACASKRWTRASSRSQNL